MDRLTDAAGLRRSVNSRSVSVLEDSREPAQDETDYSLTDGSSSSEEVYPRSLLIRTQGPAGYDKRSKTLGDGRQCRWRVRYIKSRPAYLVLALNFLVFSYQYASFTSVLALFPTVIQDRWLYQFLVAIFQNGMPLLIYPFAGWIADTKFGRYKVMRFSIWIMWLAGVLLTIVSVVRYNYYMYTVDGRREDGPNPTWIMVTMPLVMVVVYVVNAIGLAGFHVNIIPFGIDQMEDGSAEEYSCFIHWYYWSRNFSIGLALQIILHSLKNYCKESTSNASVKIDLAVLIVEVFFLTLAVCIDFIFSGVLVKEPKTQNPFKIVRKVSGFMLSNSQPVGRRSALTFTWGAGIPARSDLAKKRFGGPFDEEDVEAVKTFWNIVLLVLSLGGFVILNGAVSSYLSVHYNHFTDCRSFHIHLLTILYFERCCPSYSYSYTGR